MTPVLGTDMRHYLWKTEISALVVLCENLPQDADDALSRAHEFDAGRHFWESEEDKADRDLCIRLCLWQALVAQGQVKPYTCPVCKERYSALKKDAHEARMYRFGEIGHSPEHEDYGPYWEERFLFLDPPNALRTWGPGRYGRVERRLMRSLSTRAKAVIVELTQGIPQTDPATDQYLRELREGEKILRALRSEKNAKR